MRRSIRKGQKATNLTEPAIAKTRIWKHLELSNNLWATRPLKTKPFNWTLRIVFWQMALPWSQCHQQLKQKNWRHRRQWCKNRNNLSNLAKWGWHQRARSDDRLRATLCSCMRHLLGRKLVHRMTARRTSFSIQSKISLPTRSTC